MCQTLHSLHFFRNKYNLIAKNTMFYFAMNLNASFSVANIFQVHSLHRTEFVRTTNELYAPCLSLTACTVNLRKINDYDTLRKIMNKKLLKLTSRRKYSGRKDLH